MGSITIASVRFAGSAGSASQFVTREVDMVGLNKLSIKRGESIIINCDGSAERSFTVWVNRNGISIIQGPMNVNSQYWQFSVNGWTELSEERAIELINEK